MCTAKSQTLGQGHCEWRYRVSRCESEGTENKDIKGEGIESKDIGGKDIDGEGKGDQRCVGSPR